MCDGKNDCEDSSDEDAATCQGKTLRVILTKFFLHAVSQPMQFYQYHFGRDEKIKWDLFAMTLISKFTFFTFNSFFHIYSCAYLLCSFF